MKRLLVLTSILAMAFAATACSDDDNPNNPTDTLNPKFTAIMLPTNETPPPGITTGPDAGTSGTATVTLHLTKDGSGNITAATADFLVILNGFTGSSITNAHVHTGAAGVSGGVLFGGLAAGEWVVVNGGGTFTKTNITDITADEAQAVINNPAGFYFNVHSSVNTGGAIRGQLAAVP